MVPRLRTGNLPTDVSSFVGRRREVCELKDLLSPVPYRTAGAARPSEPAAPPVSLTATRMVTLTGGCGVGKTRLALRVATQLQREFPDGAWLVELAALADHDLLARTVVAALGLDDPSAAAPVTRLLDYVEGKELLLVLDNCEHLLADCAVLAGKLLASPGLRILATSRQALGVEGEHVHRVEPLPVPDAERLPAVGGLRQFDAVRLFVARAADVLPGFDLDDDNRLAVARLCARLDGIPLAIELAAVWLRSLSVEKVLDRLDNRFHLLASAAADGRPAWPTLWAAIDWSFDLCSAKERVLWERLSVFAGGFDLQAVQEVCTGDPITRADVFDVVAGLVDKSVLVREGHGVRARYRLLEIIRQFGQVRLAGSGTQAELRVRFRDYYLRLARQAEQDWFSHRQVDWLGRLQQEHPNLRIALEFCGTEPGEAAAGLELAGALRNFWMGAGFVGEGRRWLEQLLKQESAPSRARAKALWVAACLALMPGELAAARALLQDCHQLADQLEDPAALAYAIEYSGMAAFFTGDFPAALDLLEDALERHRAAGDLNGVSVTLNQLLSVTSILGDPRAAALGEECLFLCETQGAQWSRSYVLWANGLRRWRQGEVRHATALVRKAVRLKRLFNDPWGTGLCLEVLAWSAAARGRYTQAARLLGACRMAWERSGTALSLAAPDVACHDRCEEQALAGLGDAAFAVAFQYGTRMTLDEAIRVALDERFARV